MKTDNRHPILGLPFFVGPLEEAIDASRRGALIVAPSGPNLSGELHSVPAYRDAVRSADIILTDSAVMVSVYNRASGSRIPRHSGLKFLEALLDEPSLRRASGVFWVMPTAEEGEKIGRWLESRGFPVSASNTYVAPHYPPGPITDESLLAGIERSRPEVVVINLAGGKQEILGAWLKSQLGERSPGIVCTGAAIAFLAGTQARIPRWADRIGVGWLMRCIYEPRKFVPRYYRALPLLVMVWREARTARRSLMSWL